MSNLRSRLIGYHVQATTNPVRDEQYYRTRQINRAHIQGFIFGAVLTAFFIFLYLGA